MTEVQFFHGVPDKAEAARLLIQSLYASGRRIVVHVPDRELAERLDRALWTQPATGFTPHCPMGSPLAAETPVVIGASLEGMPHDDVLINLDGDLPPSFSRFGRLIELVGRDDADRLPARSRFKFYRDRGYAPSAQEWEVPQ